MSSGTSLRRLRWTLRSLLVLCIPVCGALAYYGQVHRQRQLAIDAFQLMESKGVDANFANGLQRTVFIFRNGNVTDADLQAFIPAFNGQAPTGYPRVVMLRLNGSRVSAKAVRRFREKVPDCKIEL